MPADLSSDGPQGQSRSPGARLRIAFVINSIGRGGAEPSLFRVIDHMQAIRYPTELHLILLDDKEEARPAPAHVIKHVCDSRGRTLASLRNLSSTLARIQPDLVVSFLIRANICNAVVSRLRRYPSIICERMHLSSHLAVNHKGIALLASKALARACYPLATQVLGVSTGVTKDLLHNFGVRRDRAGTIFNSYDLAPMRAATCQQPEVPLPDDFVVAVGRLARNKNFGQLIEAFARRPANDHLIIVGEGEDRNALQGLITRLGMAERIRLVGHVVNPLAIVARAKYYLSSSLNEGFPNAMVEAMIVGTPVVATNCPSGPAEILDGRVDLLVTGAMQAEHGVLVEPRSIDALIAGMAIMDDPARREAYRQAAMARAEGYSASTTLPAYVALFDRLLGR